MLFNSYLFVLVFLPLVVIIYHTLNKSGHFQIAKAFLFVASILFYCYGDYKSFFVLIISILVNFFISNFILCRNCNNTIRKISLTLGIILNISTLVIFKYLGFFEDIINSLFKTGLSFRLALLPLGISYYTFSQIAYLVDSYKDPAASYGLLDYALFTTFFPKISVGPISFARDMIPQFNDSLRKTVNFDNIAKGLIIFAVGLSKKVLLADNLSLFVSWGYLNIDNLGTVNAIIVMLAYTLQIYFDFSGYCDMAKAICLMLNIELADNFLSPYRSLSISEFWKRWHITLTGFFTRYVYIPLGGNRKGTLRTYINMFFIFFLSGLWHGASYNFIVWGLVHGLGISLSKALKNKMEKLPNTIRGIGTFIFINLTWVLFRASTLTEALAFYKQLFTWNPNGIDIQLVASATPDSMQFLQWMILTGLNKTPYISGCIIILAILFIATYISIFCKNSTERINTLSYSKLTVATTVILLVMSILSLSGVTEFIYTNF